MKSSNLNNALLYYLRQFPIDKWKNKIEQFVHLPDEIVYFKNQQGISYHLETNDHVMQQIYLRGIYEKNTLHHLIKLTNPSDTFVDVGANIGAYSLVMAQVLKMGKVISFEPNPMALKYLEKNIKMNKFSNITIEKKGLSNKNHNATLYNPSLTTASLYKHQSSKNKETIQLISLDSYCQKNNIENINILKIDIEGHELKCLEGANNIIEKSKKLILVMEIDTNCQNVGLKQNDLLNYMIKKKFKAYLPKAYPFKMKEINSIPKNYQDNVIFIKK